jgi:hypothetical protein
MKILEVEKVLMVDVIWQAGDSLNIGCLILSKWSQKNRRFIRTAIDNKPKIETSTVGKFR